MTAPLENAAAPSVGAAPGEPDPRGTGGMGRALRSWRMALVGLMGPIPTSIVLAFIIGAGFILLAGSNPLTGYGSMLSGSFGSGIGIANTIQRAIPLVGMGMAVAVAFRAGVLNLGMEGQMILGGLAGGLVALYMPGPGPLVAIAACIVGALVGALWGVIAAALQAGLGMPILLTTLLLNYPARFFASWVIRFPLKDESSSQVATVPFNPDSQIALIASPSSSLGQTLLNTLGKDNVLTIIGRSVNWSLLVVIALVLIIAFMNKRTVFGFESGLNGLNPAFTRYSGVNAGWMTARTMLLSGAIAGLIGTMFTIGAPNTRILDGALFNTNYAWTGLLVALLALYRPSGVAIAGIFFAAITAGAGVMGRELSMSPQIAAVIQGIVIVLIAFRVQLPQGWRRKVLANDKTTANEPGSE